MNGEGEFGLLLLGSVLSRFVIVSADHGARVARNNMSGRRILLAIS